MTGVRRVSIIDRAELARRLGVDRLRLSLAVNPTASTMPDGRKMFVCDVTLDGADLSPAQEKILAAYVAEVLGPEGVVLGVVPGKPSGSSS